MLSLKLPSSTLGERGVPSSCRRAQGYIFRSISSSRNQDPAPRLCCTTVSRQSLSCVSTSPPFPDKQLFESALWEAELSLFPTNEKWGTQEDLYHMGPHRLLLGFITVSTGRQLPFCVGRGEGKIKIRTTRNTYNHLNYRDIT